MCTMALILSWLALIPFIDTSQPRILPFCTPKTHFSGFNFNCMLVKISAKSSICVAFLLLACHHNVVNVREDISLHLVL
jgi:hypothetical protein